MSRMRLTAKLRTNPDYKAITAWLDTNGFEGAWRVVKRNAKGHPEIEIERAGLTAHYTLSSTPKGRIDIRPRIAALKRTLRAAGMIVEDFPQ